MRRRRSRNPAARLDRAAFPRSECDMPRNGAYLFNDIAGKIDWLRLECDKCQRGATR